MENSYLTYLTNIPELQWEIIKHLDYESVMKYCLGKRDFSLCYYGPFWAEKAYVDFGYPADLFYLTDLSPNERYVQILTKLGGLTRGSENYIDTPTFIKRVFAEDRDDLLSNDFIDKIPSYDVDELIVNEVIHGRRSVSSIYDQLEEDPELVEMLAISSLEEGKSDIFRDLYNNFFHHWDINLLLSASLRAESTGPYFTVMELFPQGIEHHLDIYITTNPITFNLVYSRMSDNDRSTLNWNWLLNNAIGPLGNLDFYNFLVKLVPGDYNVDINELLIGAAEYGDLNLFNFFLSQLKSSEINWTTLFATTFRNPNELILDWIFKSHSKDINWERVKNNIKYYTNGSINIYWTLLLIETINSGLESIYRSILEKRSSSIYWEYIKNKPDIVDFIKNNYPDIFREFLL